jgi:Ulp1 family protease
MITLGTNPGDAPHHIPLVSLRTLRAKQWLNQGVIQTMIDLLREREIHYRSEAVTEADRMIREGENPPIQRQDIAIFNAVFIRNNFERQYDGRYRFIRSVGYQVPADLDVQNQILLIPIHTGAVGDDSSTGHWRLVEVDFSRRRISMMDSLSYGDFRLIANGLEGFLEVYLIKSYIN